MNVKAISRRIAFREWFGLPRGAADVLAGLYEAAGAYVGSDSLIAAAGIAPGSLRYHLTLIRQALDYDGLDSGPGQVYRLDERGITECRVALSTIGEELRGAA